MLAGALMAPIDESQLSAWPACHERERGVDGPLGAWAGRLAHVY